MNYLLKIDNISKYFGQQRKTRVIDNVSLSLSEGNVLGLVGETGHGKTTIARLIIGLLEPDSGRVVYRGRSLPALKKRTFMDCASIQYVFQDPYAALDDDETIGQVLGESVKLCKRNRRKNYILPEESLKFVALGYSREWLKRKVSSLSGGQRQRLVLARALIPRPDLLIADETTSMLDLETGLDIAKLLKKLNQSQKISMIVISHQMDIIKSLCTHLAVIYKGRVMERGTLSYFLNSAKDPYANQLMQAMKLFSGGN